MLAKQKNKDGEYSKIILAPAPLLRVCNDGEVGFDGEATLMTARRLTAICCHWTWSLMKASMLWDPTRPW